MTDVFRKTGNRAVIVTTPPPGRPEPIVEGLKSLHADCTSMIQRIRLNKGTVKQCVTQGPIDRTAAL